jgi:hypothetical protein
MGPCSIELLELSEIEVGEPVDERSPYAASRQIASAEGTTRDRCPT